MMKILKFINITISYCRMAMSSDYPFLQRLEILRVLLSMYFKSKVSGHKKEVTQRIFHFTVTAYDYYALLFLFEEIFLNKEYFFHSEKPNPKILDCGANIGMSVLYFKFLYPDCSIIAFEPNPHAFALLQKNVARNRLTNTQLYNIGLSNRSGVMDFFIGADKGSVVGSLIKERGGESTLSVQTKKLSEFLNGTTCDLIKIDIEGAEFQVLEDLVASRKIGSTLRYIIEYHHKIETQKSQLSIFVEPFEKAGFEYNLKTSFNKIGEFQDIQLYLYKETPKLNLP